MNYVEGESIDETMLNIVQTYAVLLTESITSGTNGSTHNNNVEFYHPLLI